jgi:hypothetical protein
VCTHGTTYTIFVGDDHDSWVAFWNQIFTLGVGSRDTWKMFCLPPSALQDEATIEALAKFFRRYLMQNLAEEFGQFRPGPSREELNHMLNLPQ